MSILVKGMEMPKGDEMLCINVYPDGKVCINLDLKCKRIATAISVPPHGNLVDAREVSRKVRKFGFPESDYTRDEIAAWFENGDFSTIIPADPAEEGE